jgi:hypothetical protein
MAKAPDLAIPRRSVHRPDSTMARMAGLLAAAIVVLLLTGCGRQDAPEPDACRDTAEAFVHALARAPGPVRLADGTRLSTCVGRARDDADLQSLGVALKGAADALRARAASDLAAATSLGYLAGAVRAGVARNAGLTSELGRSVERTARLDDGAPQAALAAHASGLRAGTDSG